MNPPILICICTLSRKVMLRRCLEELQNALLTTKKLLEIRILVVDNSSAGDMLGVVQTAKLELDLNIVYFNETIPGLANARNAALALRNVGEDLIFIDDDEWPDTEWLEQLTKLAIARPKDIIGGDVIKVFSRGKDPFPDGFGQHNSYHPKVWGFGNVLLPSAILDGNLVQFDPRYNHSGGEDSDFCYSASELGYAISRASEAICYEEWEPARTHHQAILKAERDKSQVLTNILLKHKTERFWTILKATIKVGLGVSFAVVGFVAKNPKVNRFEIMFAQGVGAIYGLSRKLPNRY